MWKERVGKLWRKDLKAKQMMMKLWSRVFAAGSGPSPYKMVDLEALRKPPFDPFSVALLFGIRERIEFVEEDWKEAKGRYIEVGGISILALNSPPSSLSNSHPAAGQLLRLEVLAAKIKKVEWSGMVERKEEMKWTPTYCCPFNLL